MSHRTLLAVATSSGGYDCYEWPHVPRMPAGDLRRIDRRPDRHCTDPTAVYEAVSPGRHESLLVVPPTGPARRYCVLPLHLSGFREARPGRSTDPDRSVAPDRYVLVEVEDDQRAAEFRRLWDGARAVAAVLVDDRHRFRRGADRLLLRALDRLTYDRTVVGPLGERDDGR